MPGTPVVRELEEAGPEDGRAVRVGSKCAGEEVGRERDFELGEEAQDVYGFLVVEPGHAVGGGTVKTGM